MTLGSETVRSLTSAIGILRYDPRALDGFNLTIEGFWRSFAAAAAMLPASWIMSHASAMAALETGEAVEAFSMGQASVYVLASIALWPLASAIMARALGLGGHYVRYIIAYNWLSLPLAGLILIPDLAYIAGMIGPVSRGYLGLFAIGVALYYDWYLARIAFETTGLIAFLFVLLDVASSMAVAYFVTL